MLVDLINHDLEGSLWYTGSTIAQTLSASMGILGAIMLFSLQEASRSIARAAEQLAEHPHPSMNQAYIRHLVTRRGFHELARLYAGQAEGSGADTSVDLLAHHATLTWELDHDALVRNSFWTALRASGVVILFGIILCALAPPLATRQVLGWSLLAVSVVGAIGCLLLYALLLRALFRTQTEVKPK